MKSCSSNLFGAQALILILMMLSTLKIQAFDINRFDQSNAFALGEDLVAMPFGMQLLEANNADADELVIGIHGGNSEGYEWIYPLWQLNQDSNQVFFYRWNDKRCANANNANLVNHIDSLLDNYPYVEKIKIFPIHTAELISYIHLILLSNVSQTKIRILKLKYTLLHPCSLLLFC